jgi:hypothetical protein
VHPGFSSGIGLEFGARRWSAGLDARLCLRRDNEIVEVRRVESPAR